MKRILLHLLLITAAGPAFAQSSVTIFGIVDANVSHYSVGGHGSETALTHSGYNTSRIGFRGTEELSGGLKVSFWLESAVTPQDGTSAGLNFRRRSTLSLLGDWGELRAGRDHSGTFWNDSQFDPFTANGVGAGVIFKAALTSATVPFAKGLAASNPSYVRADNEISYYLPNDLRGVYGSVQYGLSNLPSTSGQGNEKYVGARLGYTNRAVVNAYTSGPVSVSDAGAFNVAVNWSKARGNVPAVAAAPDVNQASVGALYNFGPARASGEYSRVSYKALGADSVSRGWLLGAVIPVGSDDIRLAYSRVTWTSVALATEPRASQVSIGYVHNLSKRTALYGTYARMSTDGGATLMVSSSTTSLPAGFANAGSSGFDVGLRHIF